MELTKGQALELHWQMWTDMQTKLGDNPTFGQRLMFKEKWCKEHCAGYVMMKPRDKFCKMCGSKNEASDGND